MAGDWIKMRTALANDPAVIAIALDLDKSEFEIVGMLHHLWSWADSQSQNGHIKRVTEKWVDRYVHQNGFAKAMSDAGWLVLESDGITFPNFERHNGASAKKRAEATDRQRISRENRTSSSSHNSCDKSVTREEKRREEKKDQKHNVETTSQLSLGSDESETSKTPACPHQRILDLYHSALPELPAVVLLNDARKKHLSARWRESPVHQDLQFWADYFMQVKQSRFLLGQTEGRNGGKPFRATFDWLIAPSNFVKVIEGNYNA